MGRSDCLQQRRVRGGEAHGFVEDERAASQRIGEFGKPGKWHSGLAGVEKLRPPLWSWPQVTRRRNSKRRSTETADFDVRFSNRPFGVKRFQTIHHCNVDVAHGLVLLFGIDARVLPSWDSRTRRNNLLGGLAVNRTAGPSGHANSPHPSSREGHLSTARWSSSFLLSGLILNGFHAAAAACSRVQRNSVPSTQMRCMITASRRARATIAFFIPRRLAICMAHALSQDHFFECIML